MKPILYFIILLVSIISCKKPAASINLEDLNGYWEIEKAVAPNGEEKEYPFNTFVDYFSIKKDSTGYRTKLQPNFNGKYEGNLIRQKFKIKFKNNSYTIHYMVNNQSWEETLTEVTPNKLVTKTNEGVSYIYKTFEPITAE